MLRWLPDRGYMLAKPLGLLLVSYVFWLLMSFGILSNTPIGILLVVLFVIVLSLLIYRWQQSRQLPPGDIHLRQWLRTHYRLVITYEVIFAVALISWAMLRAYAPDISSAEKPMELAFFNAIGRSTSFPPQDPWFSGSTISYYYFGYVMMSLFSKLSGVTSGTAFSLSSAMWFALSAAGAFAVVANLVLLTANRFKTAVVFGVLGSILLMVMGNLEAPLDVAYTQGWGTPAMWTWLDIVELNQPYAPPPDDHPAWLPRGNWEWWWRAARLIHDYPPTQISPRLAWVLGTTPDPNNTEQEVINDFPQFSFLLGDLHPHMLNLPFVLLAIGLALNVYRAGVSDEADSLWRGRRRVPLWLMYPLILGSFGFTNTWDLPIYLFLIVAALALGQWQAHRLRLWSSLSDLVVIGALSIVPYLPYHLHQNLTLQVTGIAPDIFNGTRFTYFFLMFGPFIVIGLLFGAVLLGEAIRAGRTRLRLFAAQTLGGGLIVAILIALAMTLLGAIVFRPSAPLYNWFENLRAAMLERGITLEAHLLARLSDPWVMLCLPIALVAIFLLWRAARAAHTMPQSTGDPLRNYPFTPFVLLLFGVGLLLVLGVDVVYVVDYFKARTNSVFKFYYQAWVLWSVASAYALYYILAGPNRIQSRGRRFTAALLAGGMIGLGLIYPALAIPSRTIRTTEPMLDAMLATTSSPLYPGSYKAYAAVQWLNENVSGSPIILQGMENETDYASSLARISSWTGLPTLLGWPGHEIQWRGSGDLLQQRLTDIETIYSTTKPDIALNLLRQYHVNYVYVGGAERKRYPAKGLAKFNRLLPVVFQYRDVTIYRVP